MIQDILTLLYWKKCFFINLCIQHITISMIAILYCNHYRRLHWHLRQWIQQNPLSPFWGIINFFIQFLLYPCSAFNSAKRHRQYDGDHCPYTLCLAANGQEILIPASAMWMRNIIEASRGMGSTDFQDSYQNQAAVSPAGNHVRYPQHGNDDNRLSWYCILYRCRRLRCRHLSRHYD